MFWFYFFFPWQHHLGVSWKMGKEVGQWLYRNRSFAKGQPESWKTASVPEEGRNGLLSLPGQNAMQKGASIASHQFTVKHPLIENLLQEVLTKRHCSGGAIWPWKRCICHLFEFASGQSWRKTCSKKVAEGGKMLILKVPTSATDGIFFSSRLPFFPSLFLYFFFCLVLILPLVRIICEYSVVSKAL